MCVTFVGWPLKKKSVLFLSFTFGPVETGLIVLKVFLRFGEQNVVSVCSVYSVLFPSILAYVSSSFFVACSVMCYVNIFSPMFDCT